MSKLKFGLCEMMRPVIRRIPRGKNVLLGWLGGVDPKDQSWREAPQRYRVFYDRHLGAYVWADLALWQQRWHYFHGEYGDKLNPLLIRRFLRPGDSYVDIGANYGIHSLLASRVVGPAGRVASFEPNPEVYRVLEAHLTINRIGNCRAFQVGLSDEPGELVLRGGEENTGAFSFRASADAAQEHRVVVRRTDEALAGLELPGRVLVKIDTEGFEHRVIRGMPQFLEREDIGVVVEVTDAWLKETGSSAADLMAEMGRHGFEPWVPRQVWRGLAWDLEVTPLQPGRREDQYDVLFAKPPFMDTRR